MATKALPFTVGAQLEYGQALVGQKMTKLWPWAAALGVSLLVGVSGASADPRAARALLNDPSVRPRMSVGVEIRRGLPSDGSVPSAFTAALEDGRLPASSAPAGGVDVLINDPSLDVGDTTQSETTIVTVGDVVCAAWKDLGAQLGGTGFGFSHDGGANFTDGGDFPVLPAGSDPTLAYSVRDDTFYFAALMMSEIGLWVSRDGCESFSFVSGLFPPPLAALHDKEILAVDNEPSSPFFGRIYMGWTLFDLSFVRRQVVSHSDDAGATWSPPVTLPGTSPDWTGLWPAVAPDGDVYVALAELPPLPRAGTPADVRIYKSTDGGSTWTRMTDIASDRVFASSTAGCGSKPALNGNIDVFLFPQIAIHPDPLAPAGYVIHAVYHYDPDGPGPDDSDVFHKRSLDGAVTWSAELRLNNDLTTTDQWNPALGVNRDGVVAVSWYDRRLDPENLLFDRFAILSHDGGATFGENLRVSDVSSPVAETPPVATTATTTS